LLWAGSLTAHCQTTQTWNPNGNFRGGSGTWDTGVTQDWDSGVVWTDGNDALFSGTGGTVTLVSPTADSLTFSAMGSYLLAGGTLSLSGSAITVNSNATIASSIDGSDGLYLSGAGALTLTGTASLGLSSAVNVAGGTLVIESRVYSGPGTVGGSGGSNGIVTISGSGADWAPYQGTTINNNGTLLVTNGGTLNGGALYVESGGALALGQNSRLGPPVVVFNGGSTLTMVDGNPQTVTVNVADVSGGNVTFDLQVGAGSDQLDAIGGGFDNQSLTVFNLYGLSGTIVSGTDILIGSSGEDIREPNNFALGNVYNTGNFTYALEGTDTSEEVIVTAAATPLTTAYWTGANGNVWSVAIGGSNTNWSTDPAGANDPGLTPSATTDVIFSASNAVNQSNTVLGSDMTIDSLTINDPGPISISGSDSQPLLPNNDTLTITDNNSGGNAIAVNSGAGQVTIGANLYLGGDTQNIAVNNAAGLLLTGTVGGTGMTLTGSGTVTIAGSGDFGSGTVAVANGTLAVTGSLTGNGLVAASPGATANATVSGAGALWTNYNQLVVGQSGSAGTLLITNGGEVSLAGNNNGAAAYIGNGTGATGSMTITGTGSTLAVSGNANLYIGNSGGAGALSVTDGGAISISSPGGFDFDVGNGTGSTGSLTVSGSGSSITISDNAPYIGTNGGAGTMLITNGGTVTATGAAIENGTLTVTGSGSEFNAIFGFGIGYAGGTATMLITNGATVLAGEFDIYSLGTLGLQGNQTLNSNLVMAGGTLSLVDGQLGAVTFNGFSNNQVYMNPATFAFEVGAGSDEIVFANRLALQTSSVVNLYGLSGAVATGTDELIGNVGFVEQGALSLGNVYNGGNFTYALQHNGSSEKVIVTAAATPLTTAYWTGANGNVWSVALGGSNTNWSTDPAGANDPGLTPSATTDVIFSASNAVNQSNTVLGSDMTIDSLTINDPNAVSISGSDSQPLMPNNDTLTITDSNSGGNAIAVNSGAGQVTIGANLYLGGVTQDILVNNAAGLVLTGTLGGGGMTLSGTGVLTLAGPGNFGGGAVDIEGILALENNLSNGPGLIGNQPGSNAMVTVSGGGATWTNSGDLVIGGSGGGTLAISSGGSVSDGNSWIGYGAGSSGDVTVDGTGSAWTNAHVLYIGESGSGSLTISGGGSAQSRTGVAGDNTGSEGTVTVTGQGSQWDVAVILFVSDSGSGSLAISSGGSVSSGYTQIGHASASNGMVTVDGANSSLTATHDIYVGDSGIGMLAVTNSGQVSATGDIYVGDSGTGTLTVSSGGSLSNGYLFIGGVIANNGGSSGSVTVDGIGSNWTDQSDLYIANSGSGSLTVSNGATLINGYNNIGAVLANNAGSIGLVTIDGTGSSWTDSGDLYIANSGSGSMTVSNGGSVENGIAEFGASIANNAGSIGSVTVTGSTSTWSDDGDLYVGNSGAGTLTISNGGSVTSANIVSGAVIGNNAGAAGTVTVTGNGSSWIASSDLTVGGSGSGTLAISSGGSVSDNNGWIGYSAGSIGTVTVDGSASNWNNSGNLTVGNNGTGTLAITNGGTVSAGNFILNPGGTLALGDNPTLNSSIALQGGMVTLVDGHLNTVTLGSGSTTGPVNFDLEVGNGSDEIVSSGLYVHSSDVVNLYGLSGAVVSGTDVIIENYILPNGQMGQPEAPSFSLGNVYNTGDFTYALQRVNGFSDYLELIVSNAATPLTTAYWTGANGNVWSVAIGGTATNWSTDPAGANDPGLTPSATTDVIFSASNAANESSTVLGTDMTIDSLTINDPNPVMISGSDSQPLLANNDTLTLTDSNSASSAIAVNAGAGQVTIGANLMLGGSSQTITVNNAGGILLTGTVGGSGLTLSGSSTLTLAGPGNFDGGTVDVVGGTLLVQNTLSDEFGVVCNGGSGVLANATVSGTGSIWTTTETLVIGDCGTGSLLISGGGGVSDADALLGVNTSSSGSATVTGSGSTWTNSVALFIGESGSGSVLVTGGGLLSTGSGAVIGDQATSVGSASVSGSGSSWTDGGDLVVSNSGIGTLTIYAGASVSDSNGWIGYSGGSSGTVTLTGKGSQWINSGDLAIGGSGSGLLTLTTGARLIVSGTTTVGTGGILKLDNLAKLNPGSLVFNGGTLVTLSSLNSGGFVNIESGDMYLHTDGFNTTFSGAATGPGGLIKLGAGTLTLTGSSTLGSDLWIGGSGAVQITGGGFFSDATGVIANTGSNSMTVSGSGSQWTNTANLYAGYWGAGKLSITSGGSVLSDGTDDIGYKAGSNGAVTLSGSGSQLSAGALVIGYLGTGTLSMTAGGFVDVTGPTIIGSTGTLEIDGDSFLETGSLAINGGTVITLGSLDNARSATFGAGGATFNSNGFNSTLAGAFSGVGGLAKSGAGTVTLTGASTYTGATKVNAGGLALTTAGVRTASLGNTAITVASGATFSATLAASHFSNTINAGTTGPGAAGATLTLDPGSTFSMAGPALATFNLQQENSFTGPGFTIGGASGIAPTLIFDIGNAATGTDLLRVTSTVSVPHTGGDITIDALAGDTTLTTGTYDLITSAGGFSGTGGNGLALSGSTLAVGSTTYDLSLANSTTDDELLTVSRSVPSTEAPLTATPLIATASVPEPATAASLLSALALALAAAPVLRRRKSPQPPS
jgi:T5SS/PEP-CTERM-associated repeat protein